MEEADLLIHVVDLSNPRFMEQMEAVDDILASLKLLDKPVLKVFNKADRVNPNLAEVQCRLQHGVAVSAIDDQTLPPLIARLEAKVEELASLGGKAKRRSDLGGRGGGVG